MKLLVAGLLAAMMPLPGGAGMGPYIDDFSDHEYVAWWPPQLTTVSRAFQCHRLGETLGRDSVVVWTNGKRQVLAVGAAVSGLAMPAYGIAMVNPAFGVASDAVRLASSGYSVSVRAQRAALQVGREALRCVPTSED